MTFWENVWKQVARELPSREPLPKTWGSFFGAVLTAGLLIAIWFPIRLIHELLRAIDFSEKSDHRAEAQALFREAYDRSRDVPSKAEFAISVLAPLTLPGPLRDALFDGLRQLYAENLLLEVPAPPEDQESLEAVRWRDRLRREMPRLNPAAVDAMRAACQKAVSSASTGVPPFSGDGEIVSPLSSLVAPGAFVEDLVKPLTPDLFPAFATRYQDNVYRISGVIPGRTGKQPKLIAPSDVDDPSPFLGGTPFANLLKVPLGTELPPSVRTSHHWIVGGSGAGKTNALQYLIARDLQRAARGECSVVVLDSQRQLIETLSTVKLFAPGQPLDGKLCLLDAADVEFPIAVNLFDMKLDRIAGMSMLDREKLMNSALEMYDFIIGSLLQSEMTSRQSTLFRFVTRALFAIPGATVHTFRDLLQNGPKKYQSAIDSLDPTSRDFFASEFESSVFRQTKEQVIARLYAVLGNATFLRMFSTPRSKIDFFEEINTPGKVVLINAEKGLLKEEGTELFGRFFLALINQAAAQRSTLPREKRLPCFVYVDECHNYIRNDPKIQVILAEARQQNVGLILAHQFLGQIDQPVLRALAANTSIKMAARLESGDPAAMARDMNCTPDFIRDQPIGSFATFIRGATRSAISMHFPLDALARFERMTDWERQSVRQRNRELYANPISDESRTSASAETKPADDGASRPSYRRRRSPDE